MLVEYYLGRGMWHMVSCYWLLEGVGVCVCLCVCFRVFRVDGVVSGAGACRQGGVLVC